MPISSDNSHWLHRRDYRQTYRHGRPSAMEKSREDTLADWVGEERRAAVFADLRPEPPKLAKLVQDVCDSLQDPAVVLLGKIQAAWPELVGASIASQSRPSRIWRGCLHIEVSSPSWRYVLASQHRATILERVRAFANGALTDVNFAPPGIKPTPKSSPNT